jgi:UDP-2,4-diacetamido-2,4,6-trideoxy-beta-L-altropyranose hydrolase
MAFQSYAISQYVNFLYGEGLMEIAFRTDASLQIGTGHVMRCLTLAQAMRERGAQSTFICRPHAGHLIDFIKQQGHRTIKLEPGVNDIYTSCASNHSSWLGTEWENDAEQSRKVLGDRVVDWLVVDHYAIDQRWELALRPSTKRIFAIDDLADRHHDCDLLLDQSLGRYAQDYDGLLSHNARTLIGPTYALIRHEFSQWREYSLRRRVQPRLKNLLITMGGVDQTNATGQVLTALKQCELPADLSITVVMGQTAPWISDVQNQAAVMPRPTKVLVNINYMAQLMADSDLCIGAAGSTAWERCCLGLPTIQLVLAANQQEINTALEFSKSAISIQLDKLQLELPSLMFSLKAPDLLSEVSKNASDVCDGLGVLKTVRWLEKYHYENHIFMQ